VFKEQHVTRKFSVQSNQNFGRVFLKRHLFIAAIMSLHYSIGTRKLQ